MEFSHVSLQSQPVDRIDYFSDRSTPIGFGVEPSKFPDCLLPFAHRTSCEQTEAGTTQPVAQLSANCIFLADSLLKAHNPDLIFELVRRWLADDTYFAFKMYAQGALNALKIALTARKDISQPLVYHSDWGVQYCS